MREIKFRGKRIDKDEWVFGYLISLIDNDKSWIAEGYYKTHYEVRPETVGQFTGLKDHKGKEIFEGDIVVGLNGDPSPVYFENGSFMWDGDPLSYDFANGVEVKLPNKWAMVFGNIYENPELLKHENH